MSYEPGDPTSSQAAPGWYPVDDTSQRYWDGYEWTDNLAPLGSGQKLQQGVTENDRLYSLFMHIGGLVVSFLVPLIMWLIKKDDSPFIDHHGRQSLNFQLSILIYFVVSFVLIIVFVGILLIIVVIVLDIVFSIIAGVKAYRGEYYRIPIAIPFFS